MLKARSALCLNVPLQNLQALAHYRGPFLYKLKGLKSYIDTLVLKLGPGESFGFTHPHLKQHHASFDPVSRPKMFQNPCNNFHWFLALKMPTDSL